MILRKALDNFEKLLFGDARKGIVDSDTASASEQDILEPFRSDV